ncbi:hypothetical protein E3E31_01220 [Thermococcus sp. M39]|uniref:hypothetical protein n=1 Tax=unclassified Thermococcus TaxID=2627626 RepID=UPI00143B3893|nr:MULTISPECIES: hypothetical protein [unclassified Thermococcus]NJE07176.1 hypothetical protein [Thermococcus sp. M39]NJE12692.1 hypothetical protein [Thermococcus sp. LS2]
MEELSVPKERYDSLIFIGMHRDGTIEFIKVYGEDKEKTLEILNRFFSEKNLHPADFVLVDEGFEDVGDKKIISTRTEEELSAYLARLGLKLLSNGVLYLEGKDKIYQITAVSKELLKRIKEQKDNQEDPEAAEIEPYVDLKSVTDEVPKEFLSSLMLLELREDAIIINEAEVDLDKILRKCIKGRVKIPRYLKIHENIIQIFDEEIHEKLASQVEWVLVKTPVICWDYYVDSMEEFEFRKVEDRVYSAPLFLKAYRGYLVLSEPPVELVRKLKKIKSRGYAKFPIGVRYYKIPVDFTLIIETKDADKYKGLEFPVRIKFPIFDEEMLKKLFLKEFGIESPLSVLRQLPKEYRTMRALKDLKRLVEKLKLRNPEKGASELLKAALVIMIGEGHEGY